ncbi:unnamed protein product [Diatraea saccharalis]|uniref:Uncharacterized protein n=1 Tax=Diatraea saccharalis TaxID=40085 RepID=A0A9N9QTQ9_9NEOP|nr:unnamed protein product [Diatraea saccharalis]
MLKVFLFSILVYSFLQADGKHLRNRPSTPASKLTDETTKYPQSYRDYVFRDLSEKGKEIFFAIKIHPSCLQKNGECIPRGKCIEKKFLYISRVCYRRDLVCCYDDTIRDIVVGTDSYSSTTSTSTRNS